MVDVPVEDGHQDADQEPDREADTAHQHAILTDEDLKQLMEKQVFTGRPDQE